MISSFSEAEAFHLKINREECWCFRGFLETNCLGFVAL